MRAAIVTLFLLTSEVLMAQSLPQTTAESSHYLSTSRYDDVMAFVAAIQRADANIRVETFATTNEGRALPLVIAGPPGVVDPRSARATGLPVVFIMANIHAGEVEGKEAAQMLLRDLVSTHRKLRDDLIVLIAPIYNADGNEPISTEHRKTQHGPDHAVRVRNRFTILSEAYSYLDFRGRVEVTYEFLHEILGAVKSNGRKMQKLAAKADEQIRRGKLRKLGVRFEIKPWKETTILWERSVPAEQGHGTPDPWTEKGLIQRTGEIVPMRMMDYGIFAPTEKSDVPYAYVLGAEAHDAVRTLQTHGVVVERLTGETKLNVEQFVISDAAHAEHEFQKHHELTLTGKWRSRSETFPAGTFLVRMNQPLARLAFYLLEPRSDDGLFNWNTFDALIEDQIAPV